MQTYLLKDQKDLRALLSVHKRMPDVRLGEVLQAESLISEEQLDTALKIQQSHTTGTHHLGQILVESGLVTPEQLNIALARKLAIPFVSIEGYEIPSELITRVPPEIAQHYKVLPLAEIDGLTYKQNGKPVHNKERVVLHDMDQLPWVTKVYKDNLVPEDYFNGYMLHPYMSFYTGRGCKSRCTFCLWPQTIGGHKYRT